MEISNGNGNGNFCMSAPVVDPLNWGAAEEAMKGSYLEEVKKMVAEYRKPTVKLAGDTLTMAQVAAVVTRDDLVGVELSEAARGSVEASTNWLMESMPKGTNSYGVMTGFGATSHRRMKQGVALN